MLEKYNLDAPFMSAWFLEDTSLCDDLIEYWRHSPKQTGTIGTTERSGVEDKSIKESLDVPFLPNQQTEVWHRYRTELKKITDRYVDEYPACNRFDSWNIIDYTNIQYYPPGGGFKVWHTERGSTQFPAVSRHLVFMTFLNDVKDGGTEFLHQDLIVPAIKGLTLIWPADWTFTHKGQVSETDEKWIVTGWYNFTGGM